MLFIGQISPRIDRLSNLWSWFSAEAARLSFGCWWGPLPPHRLPGSIYPILSISTKIKSSNQSIDRSINQSLNQSIDQSINQSERSDTNSKLSRNRMHRKNDDKNREFFHGKSLLLFGFCWTNTNLNLNLNSILNRFKFRFKVKCLTAWLDSLSFWFCSSSALILFCKSALNDSRLLFFPVAFSVARTRFVSGWGFFFNSINYAKKTQIMIKKWNPMAIHWQIKDKLMTINQSNASRHTLGTNTRHSVMVVQKMMKTLMIKKAYSCWSWNSKTEPFLTIPFCLKPVSKK